MFSTVFDLHELEESKLQAFTEQTDCTLQKVCCNGSMQSYITLDCDANKSLAGHDNQKEKKRKNIKGKGRGEEG